MERLQAELRRGFEGSLETLPVRGTLVHYEPENAGAGLSAAEVASILERSARNPLGVPEPRGADRDELFATFAPILEVDVVANDDRIGFPYWAAAPAPRVDTARPTVFRRLSHTRLDGESLLQLNYIVWFPSRPRTGLLDILGGALDGVTWRVTLAPTGRPLLFGAMHNCGCYHMFFPTERLRRRGRSMRHEEPVLVKDHRALNAICD